MENIINNLSDTLNQGLQFQNQQNKITKKTVHVPKHKIKSIVEGFGQDQNDDFFQDTAQNNKMLIAQQNSNDSQELQQLTTEYNSILNLYNNAQAGITQTTTDYVNNKNTNNPYAGKNVKLNGNNTFGYVTKTGLYKWYDPTIIANTAGKNRCPPLDPKDASTYTPINITTDNYNIPGGIISTAPPLTVGNPMKLGQSCGEEGSNVIVTYGGPPEGERKYVGCYKDSKTMTKQPEGSIFNNATCGARAFQKNSQYFAMKNYNSSSGLADCYISNDVNVTKTGDGNVYTPNNLWSLGATPAISNFRSAISRFRSAKKPFAPLNANSAIMTLNGNGNIYIYDSNGNILNKSNTGLSQCNQIPIIKNASWGANIDEKNVGNLTKFVKRLNNTESTFSFSIPLHFHDPAPGKSKTFQLNYTLGNNEINKSINQNGATKANVFTVNADNIPGCDSCFLILQNGGQMSIYSGSTPYNSQGGINLNTNTLVHNFPAYDVSKSIPNPVYTASKGKTGNNWIGSGGGLNSGEWISSNDGLLVLIMQSNGNLALITFTLDNNKSCTTNAIDLNNINYGGQDSNAIYQFLIPPHNSKVGSVGYINDDAELQKYPSNMIGYTNDSISRETNVNISGSNLPKMPIKNSTADACRAASINNNNSGGYAFNNKTKECWIKDNTINTGTLTTPAQDIDLYIKSAAITNNSSSCNSSILGRVTSDLWSAYSKGSDMSPDETCGLASATTSQQANLKLLKNRLQTVASKIVVKMNALENENIQINTNMQKSTLQYAQNLGDYNNTNAEISKINSDSKSNHTVNSMVHDSDLIVLQDNYTYLLWSILAVGIFTVTLRNINK